MAESSAKKPIDDFCQKLCQLTMVCFLGPATLVLSNSEIVFRDYSASQLNLKREAGCDQIFRRAMDSLREIQFREPSQTCKRNRGTLEEDDDTRNSKIAKFYETFISYVG